MAILLSPNMNLPIPGVGTERGPDYALDINASLTLLDAHDHTPGKGALITPGAMNINATLSFNNNLATNLAGLNMVSQTITPGISTIYQSGNDLYFVDGANNNVRLTQLGGVAGTPGSITGLTFPASVTYVPSSSTYVFQSNFNKAANLDAGSILLRNINPNSTFAVTLQPPAGLTNNYPLTLPLLPAVQSFMTLDSTGLMSAPWTVDNNTIKIVGNQLAVQRNAVNTFKEHNWELNGPYPFLTYPLTNIDAIFFAPANITINSVWIYNGIAGTGSQTEFDLKVASSGAVPVSILSTTGLITSAASATIWTDSGTIIPAQAGVRKPIIATANIIAGQAISFDLITSMTGPATDARIRIFYSLT